MQRLFFPFILGQDTLTNILQDNYGMHYFKGKVLYLGTFDIFFSSKVEMSKCNFSKYIKIQYELFTWFKMNILPHLLMVGGQKKMYLPQTFLIFNLIIFNNNNNNYYYFHYFFKFAFISLCEKSFILWFNVRNISHMC